MSPKTVRVRLRPDGTIPPLTVETGTSLCIVLVRPKAYVLDVGDCCFHTDREVLLPDAELRPAHEPGPARIPGLVLAETAMTYAHNHPEKRLFVAGHADRVGQAKDNVALSEDRAKNVQLFLAGDRSGWAAHSQACHDVDDLQRILVWASSVYPDFPHPGEIDNAFGAKTREALQAVRKYVHERHGCASATSAEPEPADWEGIYLLYDEQLAMSLMITQEELERRKQALVFDDPPYAGFGEDFPLDTPAEDGIASEWNRRVEVLFLDPDESLELDASHPRGAHVFGQNRIFRLYPIDGTNVRRPTEVGIRVVDPDGIPLPRELFSLRLPSGTEITAALDDEGMFIQRDVDPGTCTLKLQDLDARSWRADEQEPVEIPEPEDEAEDDPYFDEAELPPDELPDVFDHDFDQALEDPA